MKTLIYGIEHGGKLHRDFALRVPTIGDNIDAVTDAGGGNDLAVNVALLARCLRVNIERPLLQTALKPSPAPEGFGPVFAQIRPEIDI